MRPKTEEKYNNILEGTYTYIPYRARYIYTIHHPAELVVYAYIPTRICMYIVYSIYVSCSAGYICICSPKECCYIFTRPKAEGKYNNIPEGTYTYIPCRA